METKGQEVKRLPVFKNECNFEVYNAGILMKETAKVRELITKRGTIEMLIPLCCYGCCQIQGIQTNNERL